MFEFGIFLKERLTNSTKLEELNIRTIAWVLEGKPLDEIKSTSNSIFFYLRNEERRPEHVLVQNWVIYFNVEHGNSQTEAEKIMLKAGKIAQGIKDTFFNIPTTPIVPIANHGKFKYINTDLQRYDEATFLQVKMNFELLKNNC